MKCSEETVLSRGVVETVKQSQQKTKTSQLASSYRHFAIKLTNSCSAFPSSQRLSSFSRLPASTRTRIGSSALICCCFQLFCLRQIKLAARHIASYRIVSYRITQLLYATGCLRLFIFQYSSHERQTYKWSSFWSPVLLIATEGQRIVEAFMAAMRDMTEAIKTYSTAPEAAA